MIRWERMQPRDALPVCVMMRAFHERRLGETPEAVLWENLSRCTAGDGRLDGWVIFSGAELAGYAMLSAGYDPALGRETRRLEEFFIDRPFRNTRIAGDFLAALPGLYAGCAWVEAIAEGDMKAWRLAGFRPAGTAVRRSCPEPDPAPEEKPEGNPEKKKKEKRKTGGV